MFVTYSLEAQPAQELMLSQVSLPPAIAPRGHEAERPQREAATPQDSFPQRHEVTLVTERFLRHFELEVNLMQVAANALEQLPPGDMAEIAFAGAWSAP